MTPQRKAYITEQMHNAHFTSYDHLIPLEAECREQGEISLAEELHQTQIHLYHLEEASEGLL